MSPGILARERSDLTEILTALQSWVAAHPELRDDEL
jgi:hypothetical protein